LSARSVAMMLQASGAHKNQLVCRFATISMGSQGILQTQVNANNRPRTSRCPCRAKALRNRMREARGAQQRLCRSSARCCATRAGRHGGMRQPRKCVPTRVALRVLGMWRRGVAWCVSARQWCCEVRRAKQELSVSARLRGIERTTGAMLKMSPRRQRPRH